MNRLCACIMNVCLCHCVLLCVCDLCAAVSLCVCRSDCVSQHSDLRMFLCMYYRVGLCCCLCWCQCMPG